MKNLKYSTFFPVAAACALVCFCLPVLAQQTYPFPRPAFMPSTPAATKAISTYSVAEVVGAVTTNSSQIPPGHVYRDAHYTAGIKSSWPGATNKTNIDAMVQIVLDAPETSSKREIDDAFENVRFVIQKVMNVSDSDKADALVRIVADQTDPLKARRARKFARDMFAELLDVRLLSYEKDALDDATEYREKYPRAEGELPR